MHSRRPFVVPVIAAAVGASALVALPANAIVDPAAEIVAGCVVKVGVALDWTRTTSWSDQTSSITSTAVGDPATGVFRVDTNVLRDTSPYYGATTTTGYELYQDKDPTGAEERGHKTSKPVRKYLKAVTGQKQPYWLTYPAPKKSQVAWALRNRQVDCDGLQSHLAMATGFTQSSGPGAGEVTYEAQLPGEVDTYVLDAAGVLITSTNVIDYPNGLVYTDSVGLNAYGTAVHVPNKIPTGRPQVSRAFLNNVANTYLTAHVIATTATNAAAKHDKRVSPRLIQKQDKKTAKERAEIRKLIWQLPQLDKRYTEVRKVKKTKTGVKVIDGAGANKAAFKVVAKKRRAALVYPGSS